MDMFGKLNIVNMKLQQKESNKLDPMPSITEFGKK